MKIAHVVKENPHMARGTYINRVSQWPIGIPSAIISEDVKRKDGPKNPWQPPTPSPEARQMPCVAGFADYRSPLMQIPLAGPETDANDCDHCKLMLWCSPQQNQEDRRGRTV